MYYSVDNRERSILEYVERAEKQKMFCAQHLTTGDLILFDDGGRARVVIERKTWNDLADSIKDGRIKNNSKLLAYAEQTGARVAYLIDGKCAPRADASFHNIPYRNLRAYLDHLLVRDGVIELHANGPESICARLEEFARNVSTLKSDKTEAGEVDHTALASRAISKSDSEIHVAMLMAFPFIGPCGARDLAAHSLAHILNSKNTRALLTAAKITPLDKIIAAMNLEDCDNIKYFQKCLAEIPLISATKAAGILARVPMSQLLVDWDGAAAVLRADKSLGLGAKKLAKIRAALHDVA